MGLLATGIALVALWAPPDPEAVRSALDRVLSERAYQTTIPGEKALPPTTESPDDGSDTGGSGGGTRRRHRTGHASDRSDAVDAPERGPSGGSDVGVALFWTVIVVLAVLFLVWIVSEWKGREKKVDARVPRTHAPPSPVMPAIPLDDIDALAAAGRFAEAVHLLLLRTIAALAKATTLSSSLTSREILGAVPFRAGARDVLGGLVDAVEISLFGGRAVPESEYTDCRARFDRFAALQSGRAT